MSLDGSNATLPCFDHVAERKMRVRSAPQAIGRGTRVSFRSSSPDQMATLPFVASVPSGQRPPIETVAEVRLAFEELYVFSQKFDLQEIGGIVQKAVEGLACRTNSSSLQSLESSPDPEELARVAARPLRDTLSSLFLEPHLDREGKDNLSTYERTSSRSVGILSWCNPFRLKLRPL